MLEKMGCTKIFVINIRGIGRRKKTNKREAEIIEIKPNGDLGSIILFDQKSILDNMRRGYLDTLKTLGKIDGIDYYFTKKTKWYYKRLNHKVDKDTYNLVKILLNGKDEKDIVVKALEYVMKREKFDELIKYKQSYIIKSIKGIKSDNAIYKYVKKLSIW